MLDTPLQKVVVLLLSPIILGIITGILFGDFSAGAGVGIFVMVFGLLWCVLSVGKDE